MSTFSKRLKELMEDNNKTKKDIAEYLEENYLSNIYDYLSGKITPRIDVVVKLANLFECSTDYLLGITENFDKVTVKDFNFDLRKVIKGKCSQYKLLKDNVVSRGHLNSWLNNKSLPSIDNLIKLSDYLGVSIDFLIGRI